jgi:hypothetical protein
MTIDSAPVDSSPEASRSPAPPSWRWRRTALFLAGAAQLITISALVSADPIPATWSSARRLKVVAITDAGYLAQIHQTASLAQTAKSPDDVVDHVRQQLVGLLDLQECRFEYGVLLGHPPRLEPDGTVMAGRGRWDVEKAGLPEEIELRVFGNGSITGGS